LPLESFNNYAKNYDDHFTFSLIGKAQREIVQNYLRSITDKERSILEINCGTGEDAVLLSREFKKVTCTDISEEMIKVCREKTKELKNCRSLVSSIQELDKNISEKYDIVFSDFGGINCLNKSDLKIFAVNTENLISNEGELIFVIMGRKCLWERMYFLWKSDRYKAYRRSDKQPILTNVGEAEFSTYYYSPEEIRNIFSNFNIINKKAVGFFIPPSYLNPFFEKHRTFFSILRTLDKAVRGISYLSDYSDHYLIHLKRI